MEQYVVLAQKSVLFHGIWKAQSKVSDSLARTIAAGLSSTPARVCKLLLTSTGLRLLMLDGKREQTEQVSFDSLRDILPNYYYPRCLLVIYATDPNNLSVIACSSDNVKDIDAISTAYRNHKQQTQRLRIRSHPQVTHTRTDQQKPRFLSEGHQPVVKDTFVQMRLPNGVAHETLTNTAPLRGGDINGSSQKSDLSCRSFSSSTTDTTEIEDVFSESRAPHLVHEHEVLIREPMTRAGKRVAFNLGVQTLPIDEYTDTDSINSVGSIHKLKNDMNGLTDEIKAVKILLEKSSEISREQHHRHADSRRHQNTATLKGAVKAGTSSDSPRQPIDSHLFVPTDDPGDGYDLRSVGIQTEHSSKSGRRYVKNQVKTVTSNAGKEKVGAIWKRSSSAGPKSPSASGPGAEAPSPMVGSSVQSYTSSGMGQAVSYSVHASSSPSTLKKTLTTGKTTVVRPIEDVYPSRAGRRPDTRAMPPSNNTTRVRPICQACGKKFAQLSTLRRHFESAHTKKRHICHFCDRTFSYSSDMKRHIKKHHQAPLQPLEDENPSVLASPIKEHSILEDLSDTSGPSTPIADSASAPKRPSSLLLHNIPKHATAEFNTLEYLPRDVRAVYIENWEAIKTHSNVNTRLSTYTVFHPPQRSFYT